MSDAAQPGLVQQLQRALAGTAELPRPVARLGLPLKLDHLLSAEAIARMRPAAVLVPVIDRPEGPTILLTRRAETLRNHKGQISFPGGGRDESDATYAAAALREAHEEVGLDPAGVTVMGYLDDYPVLSGYRITPVVGLVGKPFIPVVQAEEVAEVFELPLQLVLAENSFERKILSREGFNVPFFELNHGKYRIWGATAGILWNLRRKMLGLE